MAAIAISSERSAVLSSPVRGLPVIFWASSDQLSSQYIVSDLVASPSISFWSHKQKKPSKKYTTGGHFVFPYIHRFSFCGNKGAKKCLFSRKCFNTHWTEISFRVHLEQSSENMERRMSVEGQSSSKCFCPVTVGLLRQIWQLVSAQQDVYVLYWMSVCFAERRFQICWNIRSSQRQPRRPWCQLKQRWWCHGVRGDDLPSWWGY